MQDRSRFERFTERLAEDQAPTPFPGAQERQVDRMVAQGWTVNGAGQGGIVLLSKPLKSGGTLYCNVTRAGEIR